MRLFIIAIMLGPGIIKTLYLASAYSTLYIYRWTAMHVDVAMGRYAALEDGVQEVRSETGVRSV